VYNVVTVVWVRQLHRACQLREGWVGGCACTCCLCWAVGATWCCQQQMAFDVQPCGR
jgi:hypothetical protein